MVKQLNNQDIMVSQSAKARAFQALVNERPDFFEQVTNYCMLGCDDSQLGEFFGVTRDVIMFWAKHSHEFREATIAGRHAADGKVAAAMHKRAVGYSYETHRIVVEKGHATIIPVTEHVPADVGAGKFWLTNRNSRKWTESKQKDGEGGPLPLDTNITINFVGVSTSTPPQPAIAPPANDIIDITPNKSPDPRPDDGT